MNICLNRIHCELACMESAQIGKEVPKLLESARLSSETSRVGSNHIELANKCRN